MTAPRPDDFRLEREADRLLVTHTPTGAQFAFSLGGPGGPVLAQADPPRSKTRDDDRAQVQAMATALAERAARTDGPP